MKRRHAVLTAVLALSVVPLADAAPVTLRNLRTWHAPDHTRLVFDLTAPARHRVFALRSPERVVIDIFNADFSGTLPESATTGPFVAGVRNGRPDPRTLRFVLELNQAVEPRAFLLKPNEVYGHRLVIDLYGSARSTRPAAPAPRKPSGELIIAIDPGHGGEDPGAVGQRRTREKDVVLAISRELARQIDAEPGMRAVLTRTGDYYVSLRRRTEIARQRGADLFVSLHADAFPQRQVRGSSVYALSQSGASSETARWLADKENAADLAGGVSLHDKEDLLAHVLLDLSMTKTIELGVAFADEILAELRRVGKVHSPRVEQAGFVVLKSPDIPSVLVEAAYISNPTEEQQLRSRSHQRHLAGAIVRGIKRFHRRHPLNGLDAPSLEYVVRPGDTLSEIAARYNVPLGTLRRSNGLRDNVIRVGQRLRIPPASSGG